MTDKMTRSHQRRQMHSSGELSLNRFVGEMTCQELSSQQTALSAKCIVSELHGLSAKRSGS